MNPFLLVFVIVNVVAGLMCAGILVRIDNAEKKLDHLEELIKKAVREAEMEFDDI